MPATIGSAEFLLTVDQRGFVVGLAQAEQRARAAATKIDGALSGGFTGAQKSASSFTGTVSGIGRAAGGIAAITVALGALTAGFSKVAEQTQKAAQAQFQINKLYGAGAESVNAFAKAQAQLTGRTATDFQQASATAATLVRNYGFTQQQIETLIARSADLAAVSGKDVPDAAQRVIAAIRGEGEAAEALGLTLNSDAVKAFAEMTDEQRRNFESLDQVTKAQIIYRELLRQSAQVQGAAAERANDGVGAYDKLSAASDRLAAALGAGVAPGFAKIAEAMADATNKAADFVEQTNKLLALGSPDSLRRLDAIAKALTGNPAALLQQIAQGRAAAANVNPNAPPEGVVFGPSPEDIRTATTVYEAEQRRRAKERLDQAKDAADQQADAAIKGLQKEIEAAEKAYQRQRIQVEKRRDAEIKAAEDARDGSIRAIEQQAQATADAYDAQIIAAQKARDGELQAAEDRRDGTLRAINEVAQAAKDANAAQIRDAERARDQEQQAAEARRDAAVDVLDQEKRARENARIQEDRAREDETRDVLRNLERQHDARMDALAAEVKAAEAARDRRIRNIDREIEKAREASSRRIDGIEAEARAEDDRHRAAMQALDDEADARLKALDIQIKALDVQERAEASAKRMSDLQRRVTDAQRNLTRARGSGTQEQVDAARQALTSALLVGNPEAIQKAQRDLQELAGQGAEAIRQAEQNLADAQEELRQQSVDDARETEKDKLNAAKDAIRDEIEARKRALDEENRQRERQLDQERDAAEKGLQARLKALDKRKDAAKQTADKEIDAIKSRQDAEKRAYDGEVQRIRDLAESDKRAVDDRRRFEDQSLADKRKLVQETYEEEQRQIKATYDDEDTGVIPALRRAAEAAEREFGRQRQAAQDAYDDEQRRLRELYDDPENGVIAKLRQQAEAASREYAERTRAVNEAYQAERDRIKEVYDDPENGLLAKLEQSKQKTVEALQDQVEKWRTWKTDVVKEIDEALKKLDEFLKRIGDLDRITVTPNPDGINIQGGVGNQPYGPRDPGGDLAYGPVVRNASGDSYWTSGGTHGGHPAADIFAPKGSPIYAPVSGTLSAATYPLGGNTATLIGDDGRAYYFAHGNVPFMTGRVERGQQIGQVGDSGNAQGTSPHLHFAISSRGAGLFGELNGSGNVSGDSSYWGSGGRAGGDEEVELDILGRKIRVRRARTNVSGQVGDWIKEALRAAGLPADWAYDLAQIAAAESGQRNADGSVVVGTGNPTATNNQGSGATGLMQMMPGTFAENAIPGLGDILNPVANAAAAARYIKRRYGSPRGTPYFRGGAFSTIGVEGYRNGTMIREPTLMAGLVTGRLGVAGETGQPERLLGVDDTRQFGLGNSVVNVYGAGVDEVARKVVSYLHKQKLLRGVRP